MKCSMTKFSAITWIVFILFCFKSVKCERWDGNILYDLEGQGATFLAQANTWTAVSLKSAARVTTCNGNDILGGFNILVNGKGKYWEKNWANLPSHNQISFFMDFYPVDSWDKSAGNNFQMKFDSNILQGWILDVFGNSVWSHPICGSIVWNDVDHIKTYVILPHNSSTLNFRVIGQLDEATDNESFGFRNISFTFETVTTPTNYFCGSTVFPLPNNWCPCPSTRQYMSPIQSGTCYNCNSACKTCTGPNNNQCTSCDDGFYLSSGRCLPCNDTCATCTGGAYNQCKTCHPGDYLVGNNTCVSVCPSPFYDTTNTVIDFCETPCPSKFAFKNGACGTICPAPLESYILAILKACVCDSSNLDDDSCMSCDISCATCSGNTVVDCLSCFDGFYLDNGASSQNGTCEACDPSCATCYGGDANQCNSCFSDAFLVLDGSVNNGTCGTCNPACVTCDGPANTNCLSCPGSFYLDQNPSPAVDGACLACNSTCANCTGPAGNECLSCYSGDYLVTNNTCIPECNNPFFSTSNGTFDFCETPCLGKYAFSDQTCTDACTTLYQPQETAVVLKQCVCLNFTYSNGSCLASCNSPMTSREVNGQMFCDFNCPPSQYMNYDGTCLDRCDPPSIARTEDDKLFCDYGGCDSVQIKHIKHTPTGHIYDVRFFPETTCNPEAVLVEYVLNTNEDFKRILSDPQFIVKLKNKVYNVQLILSASILNDLALSLRLIGLDGTMPVPGKFVENELSQKLSNIANTASTAMGAITASNILTSLSLKNTASAWGMVGFQQFITFFKYANIDYPLQLEFFFILGGATTLSKSSNLLAKITQSQYNQTQNNEDVMDQQTPPEKFFYYDITSFFIQNGGPTFLINWIGLAVVFLIILISKIPCIKNSKVYKFVQMGDDKLRWNFVLRGFLSTGLPQGISILLQLKVFSIQMMIQDDYLTLSTVLTVVAVFYYVGMYGFIIYILSMHSCEDLKTDEIKKRYSTLVDGLKLESNWAKYYHFIILLRGTTLAGMVVFAERFSYIQVIPMIAINTGLVLFLFAKVRFEELRQTIKTIITEFFIILMEVCFLLLTWTGKTEKYYNIVAWVAFGLIGVMFLNEIIFSITSQILGVIKTLKSAKTGYNDWKKKKADAKEKAAETEKAEEPVDLLVVEPKSTLTNSPSDSSPEGKNDNDPLQTNKDEESPQSRKTESQLISGDSSPIFMRESNERQRLWRPQTLQTLRPTQTISEPVTLENLEEEHSLMDLKRVVR